MIGYHALNQLNSGESSDDDESCVSTVAEVSESSLVVEISNDEGASAAAIDDCNADVVLVAQS